MVREDATCCGVPFRHVPNKNAAARAAECMLRKMGWEEAKERKEKNIFYLRL